MDSLFLDATVDPEGPGPVVGISFGPNNSGGYRFYLIDAEGNSKSEIGQGHTGDEIPDRALVGPSGAAVLGATIVVDANVGNPSPSGTFSINPKGEFTATIYVNQGDQSLLKKNIKGKLDNGVTPIYAYISLLS